MMNKRTEEANMAAAATPPANPMDRYKTRDKANVPQRIKLLDPATGKETDDYIDVLSSLSDRFRAARDKAMREAAMVANIPHDGQREQAATDARLEMYAALVAGWSFNDTPCTPPNVVEFLREAPQLQNLIVAVADDSERFFGNA